MDKPVQIQRQDDGTFNVVDTRVGMLLEVRQTAKRAVAWAFIYNDDISGAEALWHAIDLEAARKEVGK